ncbi:D-aminoacyl-tRNA deacylase [Candidatus Micrarchaeota archaeon]|nr:D-aminoacyl-tRNA deacylase [Candidatus Micrarchaeota archaeon]
MVILFYSTLDPAAVHAANALRELRSNEKTQLRGFDAWRFDGAASGIGKPAAFDLVELPFRALNFQDADIFGADLAVFLSRHAGASGRPCFTCHLTGNFGEPKENFGGSPRNLSKASAHWLKRFYLALKETTGRVSLEATHHGPTLNTPTLFVETGSDESEWAKPENGKLLAESVLMALESPNPGGKAALGFGGAHYCSAFVHKLQKGWALSHVASKHAVASVTNEMLQQAVQKTVEPIECVFLDEGGLTSAKRKELEGWCGELGLESALI